MKKRTLREIKEERLMEMLANKGNIEDVVFEKQKTKEEKEAEKEAKRIVKEIEKEAERLAKEDNAVTHQGQVESEFPKKKK